MKKLTILVAFAIIAGAAFADVGPGPAPPSLRLVLYQSGERYTGDATATYLCSAAEERGEPTGAVQPGDMPLSCSGGACTIDRWYYKFNPCFASIGRIEVKTQNGSAVSGEFSMEKGGAYDYDMDVASGALSGKGRSDNGMPCIGGAAMMAAIMGGALFLSSKAGHGF
jgi:hypothetical protein